MIKKTNQTDDESDVSKSTIEEYTMKKGRIKEIRKVQRTIFFQGKVYIIEEEIISEYDSDDSSIETSDDDFLVEDSLTNRYVAETKGMNPINKRPILIQEDNSDGVSQNRTTPISPSSS